MAKFDVFVGREEELSLINEWANKWHTLHLIAIQGDGGVGKTWLLLNVLQNYRERDDFTVIYFDAAEQSYSVQYQMGRLAQALGPENFPRLLKGMKELSNKYYDLPIPQAQAREREILQTGVQEINQVLEEQRLIILSDTLEAWGPQVGMEGNQYIRQLSNVLLISAGRNIREVIWPRLQQDFGPERTTYIKLNSFDHTESAEFFEAVDKEGLIPSDVRNKLYLLTNGRPVLLSLSVEWLSRDVPLPGIAERSLEELQNLPEQAWQDQLARFEFELVNRVRKLRMPLDRAVLYMSHISRRTNAHVLSILLDISMAEAHELLEQLTELSFVRHNPITGNCTLHDEMKNLINKHAWPYVDPAGDVRRKLAGEIIAKYYEPRLHELTQQTREKLRYSRKPLSRPRISENEWEQWRLEAECLHYHLKLSEEDGIAYFDDRFTEAQRSNHLMRMQFLISEMESAGLTDIQDTLELRRAETLRLQGELEKAHEVCHELLAKESLSSDNRITAHNILGVIASSMNPEDAGQHYEVALKIAQEEDKTKTIGEAHNNLGQFYQLTSQLDRAADHYKWAIAVSKEAGNQTLVASATNNLAYVHRLQGDLSQADVLCRVSLAQRKRLGLERDLAYSYLTKGEIDRDRGDFESAERYTKLALRSFDKVGEARGQIMAYRSLANIRRHMERYEEAEVYLEQGIGLAERIKDDPLLASLLSVYGRQQRDRAVYLQTSDNDGAQIEDFFHSAEQHLERSVSLAARYGDQWLITRSRFELALTYFLSESRSEDEVLDLLAQVEESASRLDDRLLQGYVEETRGEIAQRNGDYATAAKHYGLAAWLIAHREGREPDRFFDRLGDRLLDIQLPREATRTLARGILTIIEETAPGELNTSLQSLRMLCQQVLSLPSL